MFAFRCVEKPVIEGLDFVGTGLVPVLTPRRTAIPPTAGSLRQPLFADFVTEGTLSTAPLGEPRKKTVSSKRFWSS